MPCESTFHRFVYRRFEQLNAGTAYHFQTRNLRNVFVFQSAPADPVMYIVDQNNTVVAFNDDYSGLASEVFYTPAASGTYRIIIRAFNTDRPGYCDLYRGANGAPPSLVEADLLFFGVSSFRQWNQGDVFETTNSGGDPYLFVFAGNKVYSDDDSGAGLNPRFVAPTSGSGIVTLGSYSRATEGGCDLCIEPGGQRAADASAGTSEQAQAGSAPVNLQSGPDLQRFTERLLNAKKELEDLDPVERDDRLQRMLDDAMSDDEKRVYESLAMAETKRFMVGPR